MKPPPPMLPADGMGDGEGEADGNGGVDGVAAGVEDLDADVGGVALAGDDHAALRANGLRGPERGREEGEGKGTAHQPRFYYPAPLRDDVLLEVRSPHRLGWLTPLQTADRQRGAECVPTLIAPRLPCTFNELLGFSALLAPDGTEEILFG